VRSYLWPDTFREPQDDDTLIRHVPQIAAHPNAINEDLRACVQEHQAMSLQQRDLTARQRGSHARLDTTLARLEPLLVRMSRQSVQEA
jgi:hypothetical protein